MEPLEKRVLDRMKVEARQLRQEQMLLAKKRAALIKEAEKARAAQSKMFAVLQDSGVPAERVMVAGTDALKKLAVTAREIAKVNAAAVEAAAGLERLDDPAERERRVGAAKELGVSEVHLTALDAAEAVLLQRGKGMHIVDLTSAALESGVVRLSGKTPTQTMSASLSKEAADPDGRFVRVAPAVWDLRTRTPAQA